MISLTTIIVKRDPRLEQDERTIHRSHVTEARLYSRVTRRLIPLLFACYVAAYLDRVNSLSAIR